MPAKSTRSFHESDYVELIDLITFAQTGRRASAVALPRQSKQPAGKESHRDERKDGEARKFVLGVSLYEVGRLDEAEGLMMPFAEQGITAALHNLAGIYQKRGDLSTASRLLTQAVEAGDTESAPALAGVLAQQGLAAESLSCIDTHVQPQHRDDVYVVVGNVLLDEERYIEAERFYVLAADHGNPFAVFNMGVVKEDLGEIEEAIVWYQRAEALGDPDAGQALAELARK